MIERVTIDEPRKRRARSQVTWAAAACAGFSGSAACFIAGVAASVATFAGVIPPSRSAAHWTIGILAAAFVLAFVGAHALDRLDEESPERLSMIEDLDNER